MILPTIASKEQQQQCIHQEDFTTTLLSIEEVEAHLISHQVSDDIQEQEYSALLQPVSQSFPAIQATIADTRPPNIHRRKVSKPSWQKAALFGIALFDTVAYAHRPSALNKKLNQQHINNESDSVSSASQGYTEPIQNNIERIEDWDMERMDYDEEYRRARMFSPQAMKMIGEMWQRQMELSDRMVKERNARADIEMKEHRERWKIESAKEAARLALIEAEGFSQVFTILGVVFQCYYDEAAAEEELLASVTTPNLADKVAHLSFAAGCRLENPTENYFKLGILQKVLPGTFVQAYDTIKDEEIFKFEFQKDMIDVKPECALDKKGTRVCEEDGLLFYGHQYKDNIGKHYADSTQVLMPGASYVVYFSDVPDYRCFTTFDKKKLLQGKEDGIDHFKGTRSHYTGLGLAGGSSVRLDVRERGDKCYPEGSSIKTTVEYKFANIMALRDISHGGDWQFSEKEMRWVGENTCAYDGSTSSYKSPDTLVKETDLREIDNTRDTYHSLSSLEVAHDYLDKATQLLKEQTGQDHACQPTKKKDELLQLREQVYVDGN